MGTTVKDQLPAEPDGANTFVEGRIEKVTFHHPDSHFTIARFRVSGEKGRITVLGHLPDPHPGAILQINGRWENHPRYGQQLRVVSAQSVMPATVDGIRTTLASGVIKGLGAKTAALLVDHFGEKTLEVITNSPERLTEVKGIGPNTASRLTTAWKAHSSLQDLMHYLNDNGINPAFGGRIFKEYGEKSIDTLNADPLRPAHDIAGIGFTISDRLLQNRGLPPDDPERVQACVLHVMQRTADQGHIYSTLNDLLTQCRRKFSIDSTIGRDAVLALVETGQLLLEEDPDDPSQKAVFIQQMHQAETAIAEKINAMLSFAGSDANPDRHRITSEILRKLAIQLSPEQAGVLEEVLTQQVAIITGGPGTGKTTLIRSITAMIESTGQNVYLCAPTGRAAKRLSEVTYHDAFTIHRLLQYNPNEESFEFNRDNPLSAQVVVVDEASMVDIFLMRHLLDAMQLTSRLILVGDVHQLPSVGPGNVLSDLMASTAIATFELREIHRQAATSPIVANAHRIRRGLPPQIEPFDDLHELSDFYYVEQRNADETVRTILSLNRHQIPQQFGLDPIRQIQVITPMHKGLLGTIHLNSALQKNLNSNPIEIQTEGLSLKVGDKVMHLKNDYGKEIFNGDSGTVVEIDATHKIVTVDFDGNLIDYDPVELTDLTLAYAITIHKSQGSEYACVIVPIMPEHKVMLQRNLLYTAVTRGKQLVIVIGSRSALQAALDNDRPQRRSSSLAGRIQKLRTS